MSDLDPMTAADPMTAVEQAAVEQAGVAPDAVVPVAAEPGEETPTAAAAAPLGAPRPPVPPRRRIRIGAVLWGLVLMAAASAALWIAVSPDRRLGAFDALLGFDAFDWTVLGVIAVGGTLTLIALAAVVRRLQARSAARGAAGPR